MSASLADPDSYTQRLHISKICKTSAGIQQSAATCRRFVEQQANKGPIPVQLSVNSDPFYEALIKGSKVPAFNAKPCILNIATA